MKINNGMAIRVKLSIPVTNLSGIMVIRAILPDSKKYVTEEKPMENTSGTPNINKSKNRMMVIDRPSDILHTSSGITCLQ
jgi:hypothetical protein